MNSPAPSFAELFKVATLGGAKLLGKAGSIGKLAPGYKADLSLVRCDCLAWPYLAPEADPLTVVMMRAKSTDVDTVLVNGRVVLKAGQPTGFDWPAVGEAMAAQLKSAPDLTAYRAVAKALRPYLAKWYASWQAPKLNAFTAFNSRQ